MAPRFRPGNDPRAPSDSDGSEHLLEESARAFLAVGSNLQPERHVPEALRLLFDAPRTTLTGISTFYRTPALAFPSDQPKLADLPGSSDTPEAGEPTSEPDFLNGVLEIRTDLSVDELREVLEEIEEALGRQRSANRFAPRTMDLDLLLFLRVSGEEEASEGPYSPRFRSPGEEFEEPDAPPRLDAPSWSVIGPEGIQVHPDVLTRAFVAVPLLELAPDLLLPPHGVPLAEIASAFDGPGGRPVGDLTEDLRARFLPS